ncbi:flagellar hook-basal body protein [Marinilactibacillus kalidii]|uniref:flagellar hook-basal body protein n=1 Tax=Marinilactibacillus kalidii TaxID=2820274 RepID=UPI001ABEE81F|nr:flagellar hook basal-body protein [Marinilactibacillus kalidii]
MNIPYSISRSGLKAQQNKLDTVSHNIANSSTLGYKQKTVSFRELLVNDITAPDVSTREGAQNMGLNRGVQSTTTGTDFSRGSLFETGSKLAMSINGEGYFSVQNSNGERVLSRDGDFTLDENKAIVNSRGQFLETNLTIPADAWPEGDFQISSTGELLIQNGNQGLISVGSVPLYNVENPQALIPDGSNGFRIAPELEGTVYSSLQNPAAFGRIESGFVEGSNVDLAQSFTDMMVTQRAYSLNAQVTRSTDDMFSLINQFS